MDKHVARKNWFISQKPVACAKCGAEYMPDQPSSAFEDFVGIGVFGSAVLVGVLVGKSLDIPGWENFVELIGLVLVLVPSFLV